MGGSQEVVSDGTVGEKVVQDTMSPNNVPAPEAGGGVIDKAHDQKKAENSDNANPHVEKKTKMEGHESNGIKARLIHEENYGSQFMRFMRIC